MAVAILYREELAEYDFGPGHPFRGDRYREFPRFLKANVSEDDNYRIIKAGQASDEDLLIICDREYIESTRLYYQSLHMGISYNAEYFRYQSADNRPLNRPGKLEEAARLIIGQAKLAADLIISGQHDKVVSIGGGMHHAKRDYGEGFCIYNDVAFAALYLSNYYKQNRIMVLDTDAHAGNGTCEYLYPNPNVLFVDLHQDPRTLYPGTGFASDIGTGEGKGFTVNVPMPIYAGYDSYKMVFDEIIAPVAEEFRPQVIIRNGGSDPHFNDGLTQLGLPVAGFKMIGQQVREMADSLCGGKVIDLIASGYNETVLPYGWLAIIAGLGNFDIEIGEPEPMPDALIKDQAVEKTKIVINEVKQYLREYWDCM